MIAHKKVVQITHTHTHKSDIYIYNVRTTNNTLYILIGGDTSDGDALHLALIQLI